MSKRLFVGVKIVPSNQLISIHHKLQLKLKDDGVKWIYLDNLHLTIKFLGKTNNQLLPEIFSTLNNVLKDLSCFKIAVKGIGKFSSKKKTKVIWLGIEDLNNQLSQISSQLNSAFTPFGFKPEKRTFKAHLTLARIKQLHNEHVLNDLISTYSNHEFQQVIIDELILYESILTSRGHIYKKLNRTQLKSSDAD